MRAIETFSNPTRMKVDEAVNLAVRLAFVAMVLHQLGVYEPGMWATLAALPWPSITMASVSAAALFAAFHGVITGVAKGALMLTLILGTAAIATGGALALCLIQFGSADRSNRVFDALMSAGNSTLARLV